MDNRIKRRGFLSLWGRRTEKEEQLRVIKVDEKESLESNEKKAKVVSTFLKHINCNIKIQLAIITLRIL